jgi:hypothetical protein
MKDVDDCFNWPFILSQLAESEQDFLVVGGAALVLHGIPRTTMDIDIFIPSESQSIVKIFTLLKDELGLSPQIESIESLVAHPELLCGQWVPFSIPEGPDIIDVYLCRPGEFYTLQESAELIELSGSEIYVAHINTLRDMKEKCGRPIDLADIALIDEYKAMLEED